MSTADDKLSQDFLDQCVRDGRITQEECDAVAVGRESSGCKRPEWQVWGGFDPNWWMKGGSDVTPQDCEIYINYPAWNMGEIAEHLGLTVGAVRASLDRTRRLLPSLRRDPAGRFGLPKLTDMKPLGLPGIPGPVLDENDIIF